jgi:hypothetical protein
MVKNLPTIERSTKIRFGRNTLDDQAENTIVFNASNTAIQANTPGALYLSPVRNRPEYDDPNIVLLMYNRTTSEITESGEAATDIIETNLNGATIRGNVINFSTVYFNNVEHTSFVTDSNVGILNTNPQHTLSIGSNVYFNDAGSNVLVVSGGVSIDGNLVVNGGVTTITTENLKIGDAIIELGKNNTSDDTTLDLGLIMTRPTSNVTIGFREGSDELVMAYTESSADSNTITPLTSESLDVHVYGRVLTEANVGILNTSPIHTLDVGSNLYVDEFGSNILVVTGNTNITGDLTVDTDTLFVDTSTNSVGIETTEPKANLHVVGNVYVSSNLTVDTETLHVDAEASHVGVNTKEPKSNLHVVGNVYISSNLTVDTETLHVDAEASHVGVNTKEPKANLHVVGNVYVSSNLTVDTETLHVDAEASHVGVNTKEPKANLHVVGNVYVSSNLTVDTETLHVDAEASHVGVNTKEPKANLHVLGNVYVSSNLTVDTETLHVDAEASHVGVNTKNPNANLHVVGNVYVSSNLTVDEDTLHVDATTNSVGIETKNPKANLHVVGNVYVSSNLTVDTETLHVDAEASHVGVNTKNPKANLHVVGNVYVSSNLTVDTDTLHVDATTNSVGIETKNPTSNLHVVGNVYVSSNVTTDGTLTLNHPTTALITDLNSNVEIKLNQLANVNINTTDVYESLRSDHVLVYDGTNWVNEYPIHNYIRIYNNSGSNLYAGNCVYIVGYHNQNLVEVGLASATSADTMPSIGIVYNDDIPEGDEGVAVAYGKVNSIDTSGFLEGDTLYVSNVGAGLLSNVKPYGVDLDLIQNIGVCTRSDNNSGAIFVTGIGRSNDIPNARIVLDETDINYVYVNDQNNDLKKIEPSNLLTQLQTLQQVTDTGNTTSNTIQFTNATTGLVTTSNLQVGSNISVAGLVDATHKHVPMVGLDGFLEKSPIYFTTGGKYVVSAAEAEFLGNLTLSGNTVILSSNNVTIEDRIFGVAANNSADQLDSGFMIEHQDEGAYANIALIYHADEHRFSISHTQNTFTDDHILHYDDPSGLIIDLRGNVQVQNSTTLSDTLDVTGAATFANDLTVGAVSNLFVDVSTSKVGINEASPQKSLDVNGDARVQDTTDAVTKTTGALVVSGGLGVASNIHSTNVYAGSHVGVGTDVTTRPVHVMANSVGGIYVNGDGNDARVSLEASETTKDPVVSFVVNGGEAFSMGIDNSLGDTFNIANHATDVGTNERLTMTPAGITTITNTTISTSKTTGALIVGGGLGVAGDVYATNVVASSNLTVDTNTLHVDSITNRVGIGVTTPAYTLDVHGTSNVGALTATSLAVDTDTLYVNPITRAVGIETSSPEANLHVVGNVYVSSNLTVDTNTLHVDAENNRIGVLTINPAYALDVHGTSNVGALTATSLAVDTDTLYVDETNKRVGIETSSPEANLHVVGNVYVSSNLEVGASALYVDTVSATSNVGVGTATPEYSLDVVGDINFSGDLYQGKSLFVSTPWTIEESPDALSYTGGNVGIGDGNPEANLHVTGNVYVSSNLNVDANVFIAGGLVTNTGGVTKKTYSHTGTITPGTAPGIAIVFSDHAFSAKITAQLIETDIEISTLMIDVTGGRRGGASTSTLNIAKGPLSIFGDATSNPWSTTVGATATTVTITPSTNLVGTGYYNIFVEYVSADAGGSVSTIGGTSTGY